MLYLKIGKRKVDCPNSWKELTLKQWVGMLEILNDHDIGKKKEEEQTEVDIAQSNLDYTVAVRDIFSFLTNVEKEFVNKINTNDMAAIIDVVNEFLTIKATPNETTKCFKFKGTTYYFPTTKMENSTFEDYIEASQLEITNKNMKAGKYAVLAEQMAILCREEGEGFNQTKIKKKTKIFSNMTMDIVWDFIFFLTKQTSTSRTYLQTYLKKI